MNTQWIIQDSFVPYSFSNLMSETLDEIKTPYIGMGVIPFSNEITGLDDIDSSIPCVVRGSTKILKNLYIENENIGSPLFEYLRKGVFYDVEKFDQSYYRAFDLPLFNKDCEIIKFSQISSYFPDYDYFAKPTMDMKFFAGLTGFNGESVKSAINRSKFYVDENVNCDFNIMVSRLKNPPSVEYRAFCVCGEITSLSRYYKNGKLSKSDDVPQRIYDAAKEFISAYSPSDIFTIDLCVSSGIIEIMEYNCWNVSGFYTRNISSTISAINDYIINR